MCYTLPHDDTMETMIFTLIKHVKNTTGAWHCLNHAMPMHHHPQDTQYYTSSEPGAQDKKQSHCFLSSINSPHKRATKSVPLSTVRRGPLPRHNAPVPTWPMRYICDNSGKIFTPPSPCEIKLTMARIRTTELPAMVDQSTADTPDKGVCVWHC